MSNKPFRMLAVLGIACATLASCKKESSSIKVNPVPKDDSKIATLKSMGFRTDGIIDKGSYYIVENDIMISKNADIFAKPLTEMVKPKIGPRTDQARTDYTITQSNVSIRIDSSIPSDGGTDDWHSAISTAIGYWNAIPNNRIVFSITTSSSADIVIKSDSGLLDNNGLNNVIAMSEFPSTSDKPGNMVLVNLDFYGNYNVSTSQKAYNIVHELGHTMGYRHSNWDTNGEPSYATSYLGPYTFNTYGANLIDGTRNSSDLNSVMNAGTALDSWNGFSKFDILAQRTVYPLDPTQIPIYRYSSSNRHFYSSRWSELGLGASGFTYESPVGYLYNYAKTGTVAFYRLYNSTTDDHLYQTSNSIPVGYHYESVLGYVYSTQVAGTVPLYRYYKSTGGHFYTLDINELGGGTNEGYTYEGIACYVVQ